jgi:large subunit ribosomal protein L10
LAITKQQKEETVAVYVDWVNRSQAMILTEYSGLSMKALNDLRARIREAGGEFHIIKNTLGIVAFDQIGLSYPEDYLDGSTAIAFAFEDSAATAKAVSDFLKSSDFLKIKGGYLGSDPIGVDQVKALAALPPLPVMRGQLLGTIMAPASKLVRTLAEPARQVASVLKAYADQGSAQAAP